MVYLFGNLENFGEGRMHEDAEIRQQLASRKGGTLASAKSPSGGSDLLVHGVHSDIGVARNGGRRGARFGARAVLAAFEGLTLPPGGRLSWSESTVADASFDEIDFNESQERESELIHIASDKTNVHLGGGHDHVYPLLMSLQSTGKPIHVVNLDAHLDTRTDPLFHSGTPFRQFAESKTVPFRLTQIGIHPFSNAESNYEELRDAEMSIVGPDSIKTITFDDQETTLFSLDCDALSSSFFSGVSAVNPLGLTRGQLYAIWDIYKNSVPHPPVVGIYEYNPVYDDASCSGAKFLAAFLYTVAFGTFGQT